MPKTGNNNIKKTEIKTYIKLLKTVTFAVENKST